MYSYQSDNNSHICHYLISKRLKETMQLNFRAKTDADLPLSYCVYRTRWNELGEESEGKGEAQTPRRGSQWEQKLKPQEQREA